MFDQQSAAFGPPVWRHSATRATPYSHKKGGSFQGLTWSNVVKPLANLPGQHVYRARGWGETESTRGDPLPQTHPSAGKYADVQVNVNDYHASQTRMGCYSVASNAEALQMTSHGTCSHGGLPRLVRNFGPTLGARQFAGEPTSLMSRAQRQSSSSARQSVGTNCGSFIESLLRSTSRQ